MIIDDTNPDKNIRFNHLVTYDWTMARTHFHDEYEINLGISGGNRFFCNDTLHEVEEGDLFLFNNKDLHKNMVEKDTKYERYLIFFNKKEIESLIDDVDLLSLFHMDRSEFKNKVSLTKNQRLHMIQFLNETIYTLKNTHFGQKTLSKVKIVELLLMIHQYYLENKGNTLTDSSNRNHISKKVDTTISYINNHLDQPLSLDILADQVYLNKFYLAEKFKSETGFTINQYIINRRVIVAQTYLQEGMSVIETTGKVGYENESHFIRTFKKHVGVTPKQYAMGKR